MVDEWYGASLMQSSRSDNRVYFYWLMDSI